MSFNTDSLKRVCSILKELFRIYVCVYSTMDSFDACVLVSLAGMNVLLVDQWVETGGTMKAAITLVERLGATVVGQTAVSQPHNSMMIPQHLMVNLFHAGVAAVAIENTEGGKWIKQNYKFSHCIPEELQSQIDQKYLDSFKLFNS